LLPVCWLLLLVVVAAQHWALLGRVPCLALACWLLLV
jgi:hypothetical protein